ncbi:MAG: YfhO family protein [Prolixibacteraceae bacterium]|jgi:hypothetical protein|nr:YfhO family protein [Prolixibacteraceae bacterium]
MNILKKTFPSIIAFLVFIVLIYAYFPPLLNGEKLSGSDSKTSRGMAKESIDYNKNNKESALWTNSMFGGMPTTFVASPKYKNYIPRIHAVLGKIVPYPIDGLLIGMLGFYILLMVFGLSPGIAFVGALAYSFFTMNFVLLATGHNTKIIAMMLFPYLIAGIVLVFKGKRLLGALLFTLALSWQIYSSHLQMTYYLIFICVAIIITELVISIKQKNIKSFLISCIFLFIGLLLTIAPHTAKMWSEIENSKYTTRGESELVRDNDQTTGLDKSYILDYSYDLGEAMTAFIPRFKGGGMSEYLGENSVFYKTLEKTQGKKRAAQIAQNAPLYWGTQPISAAPFYYGAILCFLFVLGLFMVKGKEKWWILSTVIVAFLLSLGKNIPFLANFMVDYFPGYNKFRDVKNIIVIQQFAMALMGILAIKEVYNRNITDKLFFNRLKWAFGITGGIALIFALVPSLAGSFIGNSDAQLAQSGWPKNLIEALQTDRKSVLRADAFRTFVFVALAAAGLWAFWTKKLKAQYALALWAILILADMWPINKRYLNNDDFVSKRKAEVPYSPTKADQAILSDKSPDYRVLNMSLNPWSDASTSYFHKSIGGYHGAKMRRYQDMIENHLSPEMQQISQRLQNVKTQADVDAVFSGLNSLNMLNTKYIIYNPGAAPLVNKSAMGNAWFVNQSLLVANANEEIDQVDKVNIQTTAIIDQRFAELVPTKIEIDSTASIQLLTYAPNKLVYKSQAQKDQLAVFSEIYYPKGWIATIDGEEMPHFRANYILRSMVIPAGQHEIVFEFNPKSYEIGNKISFASSLLLLLAIAGVVFVELRKRKTLKKDE